MADRLTMAISVAGFTMPSFVLALVLVLVFAVAARLAAVQRQRRARHPAILPIVTLGIGGAAILARFTRSAMLEVLGQPYIRAASAKGVTWHAVVRRHALPNAAIPTVTIVGFMVGSLMAGAVVVESVFSWPGVGRLLVSAVANRDLAVVQAILMLIAAWMVTANLAVDLAYGWLDPRLRGTAAAHWSGMAIAEHISSSSAAPPRGSVAPAAGRHAGARLARADDRDRRCGADFLVPYSITALDLQGAAGAARPDRRRHGPIRWAPTNSAATCSRG